MSVSQRNFVQWMESAEGPRRREPSEVPPVLREGDVRVVFQPLVELASGGIFAYEALVRSTSPYFRSPPALFEEAIGTRCCGALGRLVRELAVDCCNDHPLFLNLHPHEFDEGWLVQPDDPIFQHEHAVYLEITESVPLSHFALCQSVLREVRHKGVLLAVDDLGAGFSNLKYIADLAPEVVKLDRGLVHRVSRDARQRRLVASIARLCADLGARVVAEGIEEADDAAAVADAGIQYGQGYHFARPDYPPPRPVSA